MLVWSVARAQREWFLLGKGERSKLIFYPIERR